MITRMQMKRGFPVLAIAGLLLAGGDVVRADSEEECEERAPVKHEDHLGTVRLLQSLSHSRHTLGDGIREAVRTQDEVAISAKFELDDNGKLSLSVYTAGKGLETDAEHNVLQELAGSPEDKAWKPEIEVFKDVEHVSRSSQQLTLMVLSPLSLKEILAKVQKDHPGTLLSITPRLEGRKAFFQVQVAVGDNVNAGGIDEYRYDLLTGKEVLVANK